VNTGKLVILEGIDGAGKTSQWELLRDHFADDSRFVFVREPGSTPLGEACRALLRDYQLTGEERILLFTIARSALVREVILPALKAGKFVVCDRYLPSMHAYQGWNTKISWQLINTLFECTGGIEPWQVIYIDIPVDVSLQRRASEGRAADGLDPVDREYLLRVHDYYVNFVITEQWAVVDGNRCQLDVFRDVLGTLNAVLGL